MRSHRRYFEILLWIVGLALIVIMLFPFVWMISVSIKPLSEVRSIPPRLLPKEFTIKPYIDAFFRYKFGRFLLNSTVVAVAVTCIGLFTSSLAGFGFAKYSFRGRDYLFLMVLSVLMIPFHVVIIPLYMMMKAFGWIDTYWALIIPGCLVNTFGAYFMRQFILNIPTDLMEAARIDGCSEFGIYFKIILPLCKAALATLGVFIFMWTWDAFIWPLIVVSRESMRTLPVGLSILHDGYAYKWNILMAGATIAFIPMLIVFLIAQKYIIRGVALTGMKY